MQAMSVRLEHMPTGSFMGPSETSSLGSKIQNEEVDCGNGETAGGSVASSAIQAVRERQGVAKG